MSEPVRSIAIVGGGATAWLAALALARVLGPLRVTISVVDDGETAFQEAAAQPSMAMFHRALGIAEPDFMRATGATYKLGAQFEGWSDTPYFLPHGETGAAQDGVPFHQFWLKQNKHAPLEEFSLSAAAARRARFAFPSADRRSVLSSLDYAYHFDPVRYADFLRAQATRLGVNAVDTIIADAVRRPEDGFVAALALSDGRKLEADLFIDCTARGFLIGLFSGMQDWSPLFFCDRILELRRDERIEVPFGHATAEQAGWRWCIPLQDQVSHGIVYSSRHASDEEARAALLTSAHADGASAPKLHRFVAGRRTEAWKANVIALGPAAGMFEPLAWTGLHLAQSALLRLTALFPDRSCGPAEAIEFSRATASQWDRVRDFVLLHYALAGRHDTPFWREVRAVELPNELARKIAMFKNRGYVIEYDDEVFDVQNWAATFLGLGVIPRRLDPLAIQADAERNADHLERMRSLIAQAAESMSPHAAMLERTGARRAR